MPPLVQGTLYFANSPSSAPGHECWGEKEPTVSTPNSLGLIRLIIRPIHSMSLGWPWRAVWIRYGLARPSWAGAPMSLPKDQDQAARHDRMSCEGGAQKPLYPLEQRRAREQAAVARQLDSKERLLGWLYDGVKSNVEQPWPRGQTSRRERGCGPGDVLPGYDAGGLALPGGVLFLKNMSLATKTKIPVRARLGRASENCATDALERFIAVRKSPDCSSPQTHPGGCRARPRRAARKNRPS